MSDKNISEEKIEWETTFNAIPDLLMLLDENHRILKMNKAMAAKLSIRPDDSIGQTCYKLVHKSDKPIEHCPHTKLMADGKEHTKEVYDENFGGYFFVSLSPLYDSNGKLKGSVHIARDINEQKKAALALKQSEERLHLVVDATPLCIWMSGTDKLCNYFNKGWLDFRGRTFEEEFGNGWAEGVHKDDFDMCLDIYCKSFDKRQPFEVQYRLKRHDGQYRWILDKGVPCVLSDGTFIGYLGGCLDITELKEMEDKIKEANDRLLKILDSLDAVIYVTDIQTYEIIFVNRYFRNALGKDNIVGNICWKTFQEGQNGPCSFCSNDKLIDEKGEPRGKYTWEFQNTVNKRWYYVQDRAIKWINGRVVRLEIATDITERKQMEEQLEIKTIELSQLNSNLEEQVRNKINELRQKEQMLIQQSKMASMGEIIGLIAHQWKQPLNAVALIVQDLKDAYQYGELNDKYIEDSVASTMDQIKFMSKTIDDFRNYLIPSNKKTQFDVKTVIKDLILMFTHIFDKNDIEVSLNVADNTKTAAEGYQNEFKHVVLNILNNSRDAIISARNRGIKICGSIEISLSNDKDSELVIVSIRDNGGGIPENIINRIFEPYFSTKGSEGTGIGLYMSKTIIETNMNGKLRVRNVDCGAEFCIEIKCPKI
ncbi:multi-sensor signal transduction histidine kinase [Candidatus Magnetoovum chiemensis]|nr:multi-sensor signal transduction histidine kinase [Candidatus Magnetoovum chiemensis]